MKLALLLMALWPLAAPAAMACNAPASPRTIERSIDQLTFNWRTVPGVSGYYLRFRPVNGAWIDAENGALITDTSLVIKNLGPGQIIEWQVRTDCGQFDAAINTTSTLNHGSFWRQNGALRCYPYEYPDRDANSRAALLAINNEPFSLAEEEGFWQRHSRLIETRNNGPQGGTYFENEKSAFPNSMMTIINGVAEGDSTRFRFNRTFLETPDKVDGWNFNTTDSIDLWPSFTLKGQIPKYFYFGKQLGMVRGAAMAKMYNAFGLWTYDGPNPIDPLLRPHPAYTGPSQTQCYQPTCRNSWVDTRNTDNLKAMRESAAYLFTEEIGNATINQLYRSRIYNHAATLFANGYSEWDSENYYPHSIAPWLNTYTYTTDPAMKTVAKSTLDWYLAVGALKYYRGIFSGPTKRLNSGSLVPLGGGGPLFPFLYWGLSPLKHPEVDERDQYISFLSHYRPPQAHAGVARKHMALPVEMINTKPVYGTFSPTSNAPHSFETLWFDSTFQMGSVVCSGAVSDMRTFNMAVFDSQQGAKALFINSSPGTDLRHEKLAGDQVAQMRNLAIFMRPATGGNRWFIFLPNDLQVDDLTSTVFLRYEKTFVALRLFGCTLSTTQQPLTGDYANFHYRFFDVLPGAAYHGLALEARNADDFGGDYNQFMTAILTASFDDTQIASGTLTVHSTRGHYLSMTYNPSSDIPVVRRNVQQAFNWAAHNYVYKSYPRPAIRLVGANMTGTNQADAFLQVGIPRRGPMTQVANSGQLEVVSNDHVFTANVNAQGASNWSEVPATDANAGGTVVKLEIYDNNSGQLVSSHNGLWDWGGSPFVFPAIMGQPYKIIVHTADGVTHEEIIAIVTASSKPVADLGSLVKLMPNPSRGQFSLQVPQQLAGGHAEIIDLQGRSISTRTINQTLMPIDESQLPAGTYLLRVSKAGLAASHHRLVIQ